MKATTAVIVMSLAAAAAASGQTPPAQYDIAVHWSGNEVPTQVWLQANAERVTLVRATDSFVATPPLALATSARTFKLYAQYSDGQATLPIRITPAKRRLRLRVHRSDTPLACLRPVLDRLERGADYDEQIVNYFDAQWIMNRWPAGCASGSRIRVTRARYDRAFDLARPVGSDIAPDEQAIQAWAQVRPNSNATARYGLPRFEAEQLELAGLNGRSDYNYQLALIGEGDFDEALAVNQVLTDAVEVDSDLSRALRVTQGVTALRLAADRENIETLAAQE